MSAPICKRFIRIYVASYLHVHVQVRLHVYAIHVDFFSAARRRRTFDDANKTAQHRKPGKHQQQGQQRGGTGDHVVNKPKKRNYQGQPKSNGQRNDKSADGAQQQHQQKKYR